MAFTPRFKRFTARGRSSHSFRRRGLRPSRDAKGLKLQRADFFFEGLGSLPTGSASEQTTYFNICNSNLALNTGSGMEGEQLARAVNTMIRRIDINGIVFDYGWEWNGEISGNNTRALGYHYAMWGLCLDRCISDISGNVVPAALEANWSPWLSTFPVAALSATVPAEETEEIRQPLRVLWSKTNWRSNGVRQVLDQEEGALYVPDEQRLSPTTGTFNRRLRVALDDSQGLFIIHSTRNSPSSTLSGTARLFVRWIRGTLYYRFRT